jgi:hypothetical protein
MSRTVSAVLPTFDWTLPATLSAAPSACVVLLPVILPIASLTEPVTCFAAPSTRFLSMTFFLWRACVSDVQGVHRTMICFYLCTSANQRPFSLSPLDCICRFEMFDLCKRNNPYATCKRRNQHAQFVPGAGFGSRRLIAGRLQAATQSALSHSSSRNQCAGSVGKPRGAPIPCGFSG